MIGNLLILALGLLIYGSYGLWGLACLGAATVISYAAGRLIPKRPWIMWITVGVSALLLMLLKLEPYTGLGLLAPLGVSYFMLQIIGYQVDIYRGKYQPEKSLLYYGLYVTYLPHLFMGPIDGYDAGRFRSRCMSWENGFHGAARLLWGAFKKLVIAARAAVAVGVICGDTDTYRGAYALAAMVLFSIELYADFSGGIDMVLGVSEMLGIRLGENFDAPYFSESFQEFWRRWHISLGTWLRNYVYIPLGGNRKGKVRKFFNTIVVFLVSGFWHGAHYLLWGLFNGIFVCFGEKLKTRWKTLNRVVMFLAVSFLWSFFIWPDTMTALKMAASVFTGFHFGAFAAGIGELGLTMGDWIVFAAAVAALWAYDGSHQRAGEWFRGLVPAGKTAVICALALLVLVFGMYGIGFDAEAFIYSRF